jgi:hypothetical protein
MAIIEDRLADHTPAITVSRLDHTVLVVVSRGLTPELADELRHTLSDLVEGQGNLQVALDLPELTGAHGLLGFLVDLGDQLEARHGRFFVRTPRGEWERPPSGPAA